MNNGTKIAIRNQFINWAGIALFCFVGFYFSGKANIKYNQENIKNLRDNIVQQKAFNEYVKRIDQLIEIYQNNTHENIKNMEDEIKDIKMDIRSLYINMGYKTRGFEMKTIK